MNTASQYASSENLSTRINVHELYSVAPIPWHEWLFEQMNLPNGLSLLEVGCGTGMLWKKNSHRIPKFNRFELTDSSSAMIEAISTLGSTISSFHSSQCSVENLPFSSGEFDVVVANHMLYHCDNLSHALSEIRRVLRPQGVLFASTNGRAHLHEIDRLAILGNSALELDKSCEKFGLENGAFKLSQVFQHVKLWDFADHLEVTEVDHVLDFVFSLYGSTSFSDSQVEKMRSATVALVDQYGHYFVQKSSGCFVANGYKT